MNIRKTVPLLTVLAVSGISPALADCCSSFFDCAAAVVTDGLSCEIETIISTIKTLVTLTTNIINDVTGQTQNAQAAARQSVTDTINSMRMQSQQGMVDLLQAKSKADALYKEESSIRELQATTVDHLSGVQTTTQSTSPPSSSRYATSNHTQNSQAMQAAAPQSSPRANSMGTQKNGAVVQNSSTPGNPLQGTTLAQGTPGAVSLDSLKAPHGQYKDVFARGLKQITDLSNTGSSEVDQINQHLVDAQASEGAGVAAANTLAGSILSPLNSIQSQLSSMLSNPLSAFDPSSHVDSIEDAIKANLSANIGQMIDDITNGPNQAFSAAGPTYDDLLANAESAQAVANAMDRLYRERTAGAANALNALLPKERLVGLASKTTASRTPSAFGQRLSSAKLKTAISASRQKALASVRPLNLGPLHAAVETFKAQRAQGKSAQAPSMLAMYRTNTTHQLDSYFAGKSPLAAASERDQLIAQARTRFAKDTKTQNGVIGLINQEARKRGAAMTAAATQQRASTPVAQQAPATNTPSAAHVTALGTARATPPTGLAPANVAPTAMTPGTMGNSPLRSAIPTSSVAATTSQAPPKANAWGAPAAWTPPSTANPAKAATAPPAPSSAATTPQH